jgi:hypothetical protein
LFFLTNYAKIKPSNNGGDFMDNHEKHMEVFEDFAKSEETRLFTREEVINIVGAFHFLSPKEDIQEEKVVQEEEKVGKEEKKESVENFNVKKVNVEKINIENTEVKPWPKLLTHFLLQYLFYTGLLIIASLLIFGPIFDQKIGIFIVAFIWALINVGLASKIFNLEIVFLSIHRTGILHIVIFSYVLFVIAEVLNLNKSLGFVESVHISVFTLMIGAVVNIINFLSWVFKRQVNEDQQGSDDLNE